VKGWVLIGLILLSACAAAQRPEESAGVALVGGHVIPIEPAGLLPEQTILVNQGRIVAIGARQTVAIPDDYTVVDVRGKYVMPGLVDMHVHIAQEQDLKLFLRHGITQVRNMAENLPAGQLIGFPNTLHLRAKVARGELIGPRIFACGPFLDGHPPQNGITRSLRTPEEGARAVDETVAAGYDCVKVYNQLSPPVFRAIVARAKHHHIPVMGHVPHAIALTEALASMVTIEHLNVYIDNFAGTYRIPPENWADAARQTAQAGVFNTPTLVIWDHHPPYQNYAAIAQDPRYAWVPQHLRWFWEASLEALYDVTYPDKPGYPAHMLRTSLPMVKALYEGGAPLLLGTDANLTGVFPGSTLLREMELFAQAGIPPDAILKAATHHAAQALGQPEQGTVAIGQRADLLVLDANPLLDIRHVSQLHGVMTQGRWWHKTSLNSD
jgi:imidazolonepropionase-like amidohydrolase